MMTRTSVAVKRHLGEFARPIFGDYFFGDYYRALPWGPVPQTILDILHDVEDARPRSKKAKIATQYLGVAL